MYGTPFAKLSESRRATTLVSLPVLINYAGAALGHEGGRGIYMNLLVIAILLFTVSSAAAQAEERPRVFIEESVSWEVESDPTVMTTDKKGGVYVSGGGSRGGAKPRTAEIMKRFSEQCKSSIVTMYRERADFVVLMEHEGGKDLFDKDNKLAVFDRNGDLVTSGSFSRPRKAVDTACRAIEAEFRRNRSSATGENGQ
jgi:hypothetical protein